MLSGFIPLSQTISFWPDTLGDGSFLSNIGITDFENTVLSNQTITCGTPKYMTKVVE